MTSLRGRVGKERTALVASPLLPTRPRFMNVSDIAAGPTHETRPKTENFGIRKVEGKKDGITPR